MDWVSRKGVGHLAALNKKFQNGYQNYLMSNIRDLQKLKGSRKVQEHAQANTRIINPEISNYNPDSIAIKDLFQLRINKNTQQGRESFKLIPSKTLHRRGASFGTPELTERFTARLVQNPKFSVYNLPFQIESQTDRNEHRFQTPYQISKAHYQIAKAPYQISKTPYQISKAPYQISKTPYQISKAPYQISKTPYQISKAQRKIKNNYVICNNFNLINRKSSIGVHEELPQRISKASFDLLFAVGKGGFGKVWKVQAKKSKLTYAMKEMSKAKVISKKSVSSVLNQMNFLSKLNHPFIVNMTYAFQDRENLYLVMDYQDGGDLRYHLGNRQYFNEKQTKFFLSNIIIALQYLHRNKIIHRDLKPQNLVFDSQGFLKLTDLGISRQLREDNHQDTSGTPGYMAPEVMVKRPHSYTTDYYALGVIAYELMLGRRPYAGSNRKEIKDQIIARQVSVKLDQLPFKWSPYSLDFINRLIFRNPEQRLGAKGIQQLKEHPWLSDIEWQKLINRKVNPPFKPLSIQEDYQNYKEQISEDTIIENQEQILLLLRQPSTKELFENYYFEKSQSGLISKKKTSYPTNSTEENHGRK